MTQALAFIYCNVKPLKLPKHIWVHIRHKLLLFSIFTHIWCLNGTSFALKEIEIILVSEFNS